MYNRYRKASESNSNKPLRYPAADDRGGKDSDFGNFPELIAEMRQTFGNSYGISLTLPSSFWYLQHFDVVTMQDYVDWFNFMSYDIHGTWYVRSSSY